METSRELEQALEELRKQTGLNLRLSDASASGGVQQAEASEGRTAEAEPDEKQAAEKIRMLVSAYRDKYDKASFLRNLVQGNVSGTDLYTAASRFHIAETEKRILYVIECREKDITAAERIIKNLFLTKSGDQFIVLNEKQMVLIKSFRQKDGEKDYRTLADTVIDMLNTEAMIPAKTGYSEPSGNLREIPKAFREAQLALEIGRVFYSNENAFCYDRLGIGRLIHDLPEEPCRLYLKEVFGSETPVEFDEETMAIIHAFFENNLNISETARQLYVHRNTLVYRLEKVHQDTGLDMRKFDDAVEMKIALMISESLAARAQK